MDTYLDAGLTADVSNAAAAVSNAAANEAARQADDLMGGRPIPGSPEWVALSGTSVEVERELATQLLQLRIELAVGIDPIETVSACVAGVPRGSSSLERVEPPVKPRTSGGASASGWSWTATRPAISGGPLPKTSSTSPRETAESFCPAVPVTGSTTGDLVILKRHDLRVSARRVASCPKVRRCSCHRYCPAGRHRGKAGRGLLAARPAVCLCCAGVDDLAADRVELCDLGGAFHVRSCSRVRQQRGRR